MTHIIWPLTALPDLTTHIKGYSVLLGKFWLILQGMRWFMGWSSNFLEFPNLKVVPILVLFQIIMVSLAKLLALKLVSIISLKSFMLKWYKLVITKLIIWFYKRLCITYRVMLELWDSEFGWLFSCFLHLEISFSCKIGTASSLESSMKQFLWRFESNQNKSKSMTFLIVLHLKHKALLC